MGKDVDVGWTYGFLVEGTKNSVQCNFCGFISNGGITRHKHHLARDSSDVSKCKKVPNDVCQMFKESFQKKKEMKESMNQIPDFDDVVNLDEEEDEDDDELSRQTQAKRKGKADSTSNASKKVKGPLDMHFKPSGQAGKKGGNVVGSSQYKEVQKKLRLNAIQKFCRWMYDAGIPFNSVKYTSLKPAFQAIGEYGCNLKPPSYHEARIPILKLEKEHTRMILKENELEKKMYGCSLMADGWRDRKGRALINFLVNTPRGSVFIESVDASSYSHTGENLFKLFDRFIQKVGPDDVIQIVTDSASNNVLAGNFAN